MSIQHRGDSILANNALIQENETLKAQLKLLTAQIVATNDRQDFTEDCIAEIAMQVYNV